MSGILTAAGEAAIAASIGGAAVSFAAVRVGDGNGAAITPLRTMTDLVHRVGQAYPIISSARDADNPTFWRITTEIPAGQGPFTVREIAVFDTAGTMLAIAAHPTVEFVGPGAGQISIITDIVFPVTGGANVSVQISTEANSSAIGNQLRVPWMAVESASVTAPPANPAVGATYLIPAAATGAWAGQAGVLAQWTAAGWSYAGAPTGHVICLQDQAAGSANRFMRKTAAGWVSAMATDAAVGMTRLATAEELASATPGLAVPSDALKWSKVLEKPATFPADPHNHDDRYVRLASVSLARQSVGPLTLSAGDTNAAPVGGALSGVFVHNGDMAYGLRIGVVAGDGRAWLQAGRVDGAATYYNINLNPLGGNIGIGVTNPADKLEVAGNVKAVRAKAEAIDYLGAGGVTNWTTYQDANTWTLHSYARGGTVLALTKEGAVGLCGDVGVPGRVIASQGGGQPAAWALPLDLISAADLRAKIGGPTIWAAVNCWGAKPANGTTPGNLLARGCTVTTNEFSSGNPVMVVTFSTPAPNASYVVMPDNGAVSSKTANGFTYGLGNLSSSIVDLEVYL